MLQFHICIFEGFHCITVVYVFACYIRAFDHLTTAILEPITANAVLQNDHMGKILSFLNYVYAHLVVFLCFSPNYMYNW